MKQQSQNSQVQIACPAIQITPQNPRTYQLHTSILQLLEQHYQLFFSQQPSELPQLTFFDNVQQGSFQLMHDDPTSEHFRESKPAAFKEIVQEISKQDFSGLRTVWDQSFRNKLNFIADNWTEFSVCYQEPFQKFILAFKNKIDQFSLKEDESRYEFYNYFYPHLLKTISRISAKTCFLEPSSSNQQQKEDQKEKNMLLNNNIFKHFVREQQIKANKAGACYVDIKTKDPNQPPPKEPDQGQKIPIGQYIVEKNLFQENTQIWSQIHFEAMASRRFNKSITKCEDVHRQIDSVYEFSQLLLNNNELIQPANRLCCDKFFYFNFDINPLHSHNVINRNNLFEFKQKPTRNNKKNSVQACNPSLIEDIMVDICALLNSGGGVILFNCIKEYLELRPVGETIVEKDKEKYMELIQKGLKKICPTVLKGQEVKLSFVPMVKNPYEHGYMKQVLDEEDKKIRRHYIKGAYVFRIAVFPSQKEQVYYYEVAKDVVKSAIIQDGKRHILKGEELVEEMKKRFQFYELEEEDQLQRELLGKDSMAEDEHTCVEPYPGDPLHTAPTPDIPTPNEHFQHVSLLVAPSKYWAKIERQLNKRGVDCKIDSYFLNKYPNFPLPQSSAPIYHNIRFDQLLVQIAYQPQFVFDTRPALLINVTKCIKLKCRIGQNHQLFQQDYKHLQNWITNEPKFASEKLEYWLYNVNGKGTEQQHYLRTQSDLSMIFLYYVLNYSKQKALMKNPSNPSDISQQQKKSFSKETHRKLVNSRMKLQYSSHQPPFFPENDDIRP